jgi:HK97 family phage major capsid protein
LKLSSELDKQVSELTAQVMELAKELEKKEEIPVDRVTAIEDEINTKSAQLAKLEAEKRQQEIDARLKSLDDRLKAYHQGQVSAKAQAILAGVDSGPKPRSIGEYSETNFLKALVDRRTGNPDAYEFVKSVLGTSDATGQAIVPNNFVAALVEALTLSNPYRGVFDVVDGVQGVAVDIPYSITAVTQALLQGAYGSNKDVRDFSFAQATATLYQIAQIADIGNQLLRQSNGAAERSARRRLAGSIGMLEAVYITNGSGSSQPLGFFPALAAFGDPAAFRTTLSSEPRLATMARGIAAMESRGVSRANLVFAMSPTDYWETAAEGLGTSYAGGWAVEPAQGAAGQPPITSAWGVRLLSDPNWPAAKVGTGLLIDASEVQIFTGQGYRIDVSSEAGNRFDQNITAFRAEEEFGFNAEPYVRTGRVQQVIGI